MPYYVQFHLVYLKTNFATQVMVFPLDSIKVCSRCGCEYCKAKICPGCGKDVC